MGVVSPKQKEMRREGQKKIVMIRVRRKKQEMEEKENKEERCKEKGETSGEKQRR